MLKVQAMNDYDPPRIDEIGDLIDLTAAPQKPCQTGDGVSGSTGNCSGPKPIGS